MYVFCCFFFFSSRRRHTRWPRDWSSDVCSSDLLGLEAHFRPRVGIDLSEEGDLDLTREEEILQAGKAAALVLLHVVLGQVADEVAGDTHVEEKLPGAA